MKKLLFALVLLVGLGNVANAQSNLAHVDLQKLWDTIPSSKMAQEKILAAQEELYKELTDLQMAYQKAADDYTKLINSPEPPSELRRQAEQREVDNKMQILQRRQQTGQEELQLLQMELEEPMTDRIKKAIAIVAERKKLTYVMDVNAVIYSAGGEDITNEVAVELLKLEAEATKSSSTEGTGAQ